MWRFMIYVFIDDFARYHDDIKRNDTYNILSAYIIVNYLSYIKIKKNYNNKKNILDWLIDRLLFLYNEYFEKRNIIILNNVNVHVDSRIIKII